MKSLPKLSLVALFAVAMAYVEASVVAYLREIYAIDDLLRDMPAETGRLAAIELGREAATLVMLFAVGWVAGRRFQDRLGFFVFAFGLWDIAYYGWLNVFLGWPTSLLEWDILFLLPLPWWGPVLAPVLIAIMMCIGGAAAVRQADEGIAWRMTRQNVAIAAAGIAVVLYTFMADAIGRTPDGLTAVAETRPTEFQWPLFFLGFILMSWAGLRVTWPARTRLLLT